MPLFLVQFVPKGLKSKVLSYPVICPLYLFPLSILLFLLTSHFAKSLSYRVLPCLLLFYKYSFSLPFKLCPFHLVKLAILPSLLTIPSIRVNNDKYNDLHNDSI